MKSKLPEPTLDGPVSLEQSLRKRRCRRKFSALPLTLQEVSQLAWAAQGITSLIPDTVRGAAGRQPSN